MNVSSFHNFYIIWGILIMFGRSMYMNALPCFQFELFPFNELEWWNIVYLIAYISFEAF